MLGAQRDVDNTSAAAIEQKASPQSVDEKLRLLNGRLATLHALLPSRTALLIFTGHSDPRKMANLQARKTTFENALRAGKKAEDIDRMTWWTAADGRTLEEEVETARRGLLLLCLKE